MPRPVDSPVRLRPSLVGGFALVLLAFAALSPYGLAAQPSSSPFTSAERRSLIAGELVQRQTVTRDGRQRFHGGTSWMRVRAPIDQVWQMVNDAGVYPRLIPSLDRTRVVERDGNRQVLYMHHAFGIAEADYYAVMELDPPTHSLRFHLDSSRPHGGLQAGHGFLSLRSFRGDTIVSWGMVADVGGGVIAQVFGPVLSERLLLPPRCLRDEIEPGYENTCAP